MSLIRNLWGWLSGCDQQAFAAAMHQLREEVFALPLDEAQRQAFGHLADPNKFRCVSASGGAPSRVDTPLPPLVQEFFSRYDEVLECYGDVRLSRDEIGPSQIDARYTRIGSNTGHTEIAVLTPAEDVYEKDWSDSASSDSLTRYPTLYHFILFRVRLLDPTVR